MEEGGDPPDFQFPYEEKRIAMEHTQVFRDQQRSASAHGYPFSPDFDAAVQNSICRYMMDELLKGTWDAKPCMDIGLGFNSCRAVQKKHEKAVALAVLDLVRKRVENGTSIPIYLNVTDLRAISSCLYDAYVSHAPPGRTSSSVWPLNSPGGVDESGLYIFEAASQKKAKQLHEYRANFYQCWLLLSSSGSHPANFIEPSPAACTKGIKSQFDRVYFVDESGRLDATRPQVYRINVHR